MTRKQAAHSALVRPSVRAHVTGMLLRTSPTVGRMDGYDVLSGGGLSPDTSDAELPAAPYRDPEVSTPTSPFNLSAAHCPNCQ
jgi:hypothetical protein